MATAHPPLDGGSGAPRTPRPLTFLDLPRETQENIFSCCFRNELICLALVSKHFHELAAAQLYRDFHIEFPGDDDPDSDLPLDGLANGLDTLATSEYNYCKHLKDIYLDTLTASDKVQEAYKSYQYGLSCGKFMNSLLLLALKRSTSLESFRWNIRVELSRPVYNALHRIPTLNHVHIRLQAGPSLYEPPRPLPLPSLSHLPESPVNLPPPPPPPAHFINPTAGNFFNPSHPSNQVLFEMSYPILPPTHPFLPPPKLPQRNKASRRFPSTNAPPTFSGFKQLRRLSVLDIDDLSIVDELRTCIRNSQSTLTELKLSFSTDLAMLARRPALEFGLDESESDDEFEAMATIPSVTPPTNAIFEQSLQMRMQKAQEERRKQESVLGRILDVEQLPTRLFSRPKEKAGEPERGESPMEELLSGFTSALGKLMLDATDSKHLTEAQTSMLNTIKATVRQYMDSDPTNKAPPAVGAGSGNASSSSAAGPAPQSEEVAAPDFPSPSTRRSAEGPTTQGSLFDPKPTKPKASSSRDPSPDDIDIEDSGDIEDEGDDSSTAPQETLPLDSAAGSEPGHQGCATTASSSRPTPGKTPSPDTGAPLLAPKDAAPPPSAKEYAGSLMLELDKYQEQADLLSKELERVGQEIRADPTQLHRTEQEIQALSKQNQVLLYHNQVLLQYILMVKYKLKKAEKHMPILEAENSDNVQSRRISEYIKSTRGLALESLSIYLIPVRASVLSRAINLHALTKLTLLNVGSQAPIWGLLAKENEMQPLALRSIFSDNVSLTLLKFANKLDELHEFLILERSPKHKPESFAPKSVVTIDDIRRHVLKKHLSTLRVLMIRNEDGLAWDLDTKSMIRICWQGKVLRELAANISISVVHTLLQHLSGLISLVALYIIHFRSEDTCAWVTRETRQFIADTIAHCPGLKLEFLCVDSDRVDYLWRSPRRRENEQLSTDESSKAKGKGKAIGNMGAFGSSNGVNSDSSGPVDYSSDNDPEPDLRDDLRVTSGSDMQFHETWGTRIFQKEVLAARL